MKILGIIPARGGSKGVPGKNIKVLGSKPLIQYTLEAAEQSKLLSKVIVSTDSEPIADCVKSLGGTIPFIRPASLAQDETPTLSVIQHALDFYLEQGESFDAVCLLQVTSPFRMPGFIDKALSKFIEADCDSIISVLPVPTEFNPHWIFEPDERGYLKIATGESNIISRRQDLPQAYFRDGSIYITKSEIIVNQQSLLGQKISFLANGPQWHVNIDTLHDWEVAERMVEKYMKQCAQ